MLLDLYYKMLWWHAVGAATTITEVNSPNARLADGSYQNKIYMGSTSSYIYEGPIGCSRSILAIPIKAMLGQEELLTVANSKCGYSWTNFIVGSGETPVTASDYRIENEITSGLTCESVTAAVDESDGTITYRKTLTNSSDSEITIREIGLASAYYVTGTSNSAKQALIYREVLETPLVLAPGESGTVAITIKHTLPST